MLDDVLPQDEAVYRAVLALPGAAVDRLADELGWPVAMATESLDRLADIGLVHSGPDRALIASPPELVLGPRLARSRERLRHSEEVLAQFAETYHREMAPARGHDLVELIEGPESDRPPAAPAGVWRPAHHPRLPVGRQPGDPSLRHLRGANGPGRRG